jgi:hypothetical protein
MTEAGPATADDMVLAFLQAEIDSPRFAPNLNKWLAHYRLDRATLIDNGLLSDPGQNRLRAEALKATRGYQANIWLFAGFPSDVQWRRVQVDPAELADFKYAKFDPLIAVSGESRRVGDGASSFEAGNAGDEFSERVSGVVGRIKDGARFPDLIAVAADNEPPVLVEGHTRATAYVHTKPSHPIFVLVGTSPTIKQWAFF